MSQSVSEGMSINLAESGYAPIGEWYHHEMGHRHLRVSSPVARFVSTTYTSAAIPLVVIFHWREQHLLPSTSGPHGPIKMLCLSIIPTWECMTRLTKTQLKEAAENNWSRCRTIRINIRAGCTRVEMAGMARSSSWKFIIEMWCRASATRESATQHDENSCSAKWTHLSLYRAWLG